MRKRTKAEVLKIAQRRECHRRSAGSRSTDSERTKKRSPASTNKSRAKRTIQVSRALQGETWGRRRELNAGERSRTGKKKQKDLQAAVREKRRVAGIAKRSNYRVTLKKDAKRKGPRERGGDQARRDT